MLDNALNILLSSSFRRFQQGDLNLSMKTFGNNADETGMEDSRPDENALHTALTSCGVLSMSDELSPDEGVMDMDSVYHALQSCGILSMTDSQSHHHNDIW